MDFYIFLGTVAATIFMLLGTMFYMVYGKTRVQENNIVSSFPCNSIHHVFPSFHGPDVRKSFLSHILKEFRSKGIEPFIDNNIERSKSIGLELIEAIRGSRIAIVLLSKNYASSTWCMNELVEIIKCREELDQIVMTIFYDVDPTDVKKQTGYFGKVFKKTCKGKTKEDIRRWRQAFAEVATIAGEHSSQWENEADMIEKIVTDVSNKLHYSSPSMGFECLVGMVTHMEKMGPLLRLDLDEVRMIGIWGPPGIGKTTIARFLFSHHSKDFQLSVFMENIKETCTIPASCGDFRAKLHFQEQFMSQITNQLDIKIPHLGIIKDRLKDKKVLVVLDGVDQLVQLEAMVKETCWFGPPSRIIITTQDLKLLRAHGIDHVYKVAFPSTNEAFQIFCMYAFGQKSPKDGFRELALEVTYLAGNLPLGLQVMGSYFKGLPEEDWSMELPRVRANLNQNIESVLRFSYDALCDEDKNLFLYIACYFNYEDTEKVVGHLEKSFLSVSRGLHVLAEKSLITIDYGVIQMHSLLVQLGKDIVRKQPGKRQFLVDHKDIVEVLTDPTQITRSVIGIDYRGLIKLDKLNISERDFEGMSSLQFLRLDGQTNIASLVERMKCISPKLQLLDWENWPMTSSPSIINLELLVELSMRFNHLEKLWEGIKVPNLKWIDLSHSENLKELPDLSTATDLRKLDLYECSNLVELPSLVGNSLQVIDLRGCSSLVKLPFLFGNPINLQTLVLSGCSSLVELPFWIGNATNLLELDCSGCSSLLKLPSSIGNLHRLTEFNLEECSKLEVLPTNINLESLITLNLTNCSSKCFPEISTNIRVLKLSGTAVEEIPTSVRSWSIRSIYAVNCVSLERLDCSFSNSVFSLNFRSCFKLNQEARDVIIQTSTSKDSVLPGREVPAWFTYRASGSFVTVNLNEQPLCTSIKFKACILFDDKRKNVGRWLDVECRATSKQNALTCRRRNRHSLYPFPEHLYIFEVEAEDVTSTELVFEFKVEHSDVGTWEIKECGILQLELQGDEKDAEFSDEDYTCGLISRCSK